MRSMIAVATVATLALFVTACDNVDLPVTTGDGLGSVTLPSVTEAPPDTEAPPETEAPPDTEAPPETEAPTDEEGEGETPWWILIVAGLLFLMLVIVLGASGRKKDVYVAKTGESWKDLARSGYAESRWLFDNLTEGLAIWRGNAQYDSSVEVGATPETANAEAWQQLSPRMQHATDRLYAFEAAAPDRRSAEMARRAIGGLNATRTAFDSRAEARYAYRAAEAEAEGQPDRAASLATSRDREQRAAQNLADRRRELAEALTALSAIT